MLWQLAVLRLIMCTQPMPVLRVNHWAGIGSLEHISLAESLHVKTLPCLSTLNKQVD